MPANGRRDLIPRLKSKENVFIILDTKKVNVYLPSLMMKVPNYLYVLGDTYTCHM
jgi:hypothetical protein